jgi:hypothetical protein
MATLHTFAYGVTFNGIVALPGGRTLRLDTLGESVDMVSYVGNDIFKIKAFLLDLVRPHTARALQFIDEGHELIGKPMLNIGGEIVSVMLKTGESEPVLVVFREPTRLKGAIE